MEISERLSKHYFIVLSHLTHNGTLISVSIDPIGNLRSEDGDGSENIGLKCEFAFIQSSWQQFQLNYFVRCRRTLLELNS